MVIKQTSEFQRWMDKLRDMRAKARVAFRLTQVENGNLGDFKSVGKEVFELRID